MTKQKQINVRVGFPTLNKLIELVKLYGSQTQVIAVAIDRLYTSEIKQENKMISRYEQEQRDYIIDAIVADGGWQTIIDSYSGMTVMEIIDDLNDWNTDGRGDVNEDLAKRIFDALN